MSVMMTSNLSVPSAGNVDDILSRSHPKLRDHFEAFLCGQKIDIEETKVGCHESFVAQTPQKVSLSGEEMRYKTESSTCGVAVLNDHFSRVPIKTEKPDEEVAALNDQFSRVPIKTEKPDEQTRTDSEVYVSRLDGDGIMGRPVRIKSEKLDFYDEGVSCQPTFPVPFSPDGIKIKQEKDDTVCIKTEKEDKHHENTSSNNQVFNASVGTCLTPIKIEADNSCDIRHVVVKTETHTNDVASQQLQRGSAIIDGADGLAHCHNTNGDISKTVSMPEGIPLCIDLPTESNETECNHNRSRERKAKKLAKMMLKELEENLDFLDAVDGKHSGSLQKSDTYISYSSHSSVSWRRLQDLNNDFNKYKDTFSLKECSVKVQRLSEKVLIRYGVNSSVLIPEKKNHLEILKKGLFPCSKCSFRSDHLLTLQRHLKSKHAERSYHKCLECDYQANWSESLAHHVKRIHRKERPWQCQHCNHACATRQELKTHEITHSGDRPFKCPHCEYRASHKGSIKTHLYTHTGEKPFACPHCSYRCTQYPHLKSHLYIHADTWPFGCKLCSYKTRQSSHLRTHMRLIHTNSRPYKCRFCKYTLKTSQALKCHERRHTGEKPYSCHLCPYKARQSAPLRTHIRKKHAAADADSSNA